jgi:acetolactate synthase-1/2/3 large subunit
MLVVAGRNPIFEDEVLGSRDLRIHWAQESFDQGAMVREYVKWDYELRDFRQLEVVVDRALASAVSYPQGPVYLSLPRERLASKQKSFSFHERNRLDAGAETQADLKSVERATDLIAGAESPLIIVNNMGRDTASVAELVALAEAASIPVVEVFRQSMNFPAEHPLHLGFSPAPMLKEADLILAIEADVPWLPRRVVPKADTTVIQIGRDPFFRRYPIRGFPLDVALVGSPALSLASLREALEKRLAGKEKGLLERKEKYASRHQQFVDSRRKAADEASKLKPISMDWLSRCVGDAVDDSTILVNEYDLRADQLNLNRPGSYFGSPAVSGLGWGFGAALGAKLGAPESTVICTLGDGAYIFNNPVACHMTAAAQELPILLIVFNNQVWNAVRSSVADVAPDGWAVSRDDYAFVHLTPSPDFEKIAEACGGYGERVEDPDDIPAAIQRGLTEVREHKRHALLNVICRI